MVSILTGSDDVNKYNLKTLFEIKNFDVYEIINSMVVPPSRK